MTTEDSNYGSWITEDLINLIDQLTEDKKMAETYSERVELNRTILKIKSEIFKREKDE
jgi:hypothetical protein